MSDTIQYKPIPGLNETSLNKLIEISGKDLATKEDVNNAVSNVTVDTSNLATKSEVNNKVDKVEGKGLSSNDYTTAEKTKLAGLSNYDDTEIKGKVSTLETKSNTIEGKITTVESDIAQLKTDVENAVSQEMIDTAIQKKIDDGTIANLTIEDNSITTSKLADYSVTQEKIDPNVKLGGTLKVRDLLEGEAVVNMSGITADRYLEALFDFSGLSAEDVKVTDVTDSNKFFTLNTVEPSKNGAYALGYNGKLIENTKSFAVGLIFRGDRTIGTGIFKFDGGDSSAINFNTESIAFTHTDYYGSIKNVPIDLETFLFLLVGFDTLRDTMNVWVNGVKKASFSLGGKKIGGIGYLNKGYWNDGTCIFNKIAVFNKGNFGDREVKAITDYIFTIPKYVNVDTSKSFLSIKNGLVRHLTVKNNTDGVIKDIVYNDTVRNTTSVTTEGFVLSERTLLNPNYSIKSNGGGVFIRFDKTSDTNNQYLINYNTTKYLWVNFNSNKICIRDDARWLIEERTAQFTEKNVLYFDSSKKVYLNGEYLCDLNYDFNFLETLIKDLKNEYPIKDYVCYVESLNDDEINTISTELCSY